MNSAGAGIVTSRAHAVAGRALSCSDPIYFCRLGEIRDRSFENQFFRASGLNLLVAAIILWNAKYLEVAYTELRRQGRAVNETLLRHVAPLGWEHIGLTGGLRLEHRRRAACWPAQAAAPPPIASGSLTFTLRPTCRTLRSLSCSDPDLLQTMALTLLMDKQTRSNFVPRLAAF